MMEVVLPGFDSQAFVALERTAQAAAVGQTGEVLVLPPWQNSCLAVEIVPNDFDSQTIIIPEGCLLDAANFMALMAQSNNVTLSNPEDLTRMLRDLGAKEVNGAWTWSGRVEIPIRGAGDTTFQYTFGDKTFIAPMELVQSFADSSLINPSGQGSVETITATPAIEPTAWTESISPTETPMIMSTVVVNPTNGVEILLTPPPPAETGGQNGSAAGNGSAGGKGKDKFPWGGAIGGVIGLGLLGYASTKLDERKRRTQANRPSAWKTNPVPVETSAQPVSQSAPPVAVSSRSEIAKMVADAERADTNARIRAIQKHIPQNSGSSEPSSHEQQMAAFEAEHGGKYKHPDRPDAPRHLSSFVAIAADETDKSRKNR